MANTESKTSQFIEITVLTKTEAVQFLEATDWVVDEALQLFFTVGRDGLRDALPPQNPGRSFASDYNAYLRESAYRAIYRDHLRQSSLRAGVGPETSPRTSPGNSGLSRNEYADEEPVTREGQVRPGRAPSPGHSTRAELSRGRAQTIAPPFHLLSFGSFEAVKVRAQSKGKWILANVQTDESESELNNV